MDFDFKNTIPQNSRTIIFEKFNDRELPNGENMPNLCTLLKGRNSEEAVNAISEKLLVHSFNEFKEKFDPTVYEKINIGADGQLLGISYSIDSDDGGTPVSLCSHDFYKAVHEIIESKSNSGKNNEDSDYEKLYDALKPESIYKRAKRRRSEAKEFLFNAIKENEKNNPDGKKKWLRLAQTTFNDVKNEYSGSALRLLPLAIEDSQKIINSRNDGNDTKQIATGAEKAEALPLYSLKWDSNGELKPVKQETATLSITKQDDSCTQLVAKNWEKVADSMPEGSVDKNLFMSVYAEQKNMALQTMSTNELKQRVDVMSEIYNVAQQSFFNAIGLLVQKVAGVEQFFRHAGDEKGEVKAGVIIANCTLDDVFENEENVRNFLESLKTSPKERIWFAVLPSASYESVKKNESDNDFEVELDFDDIDINDINDNTKMSVSIGDINRMTKMLKDCGILSFFNFHDPENTSFIAFEEKILEHYQEETEIIEAKDSVVLAFPNFTVIPKNKCGFESVGSKKLCMPPVYIDSAYVAAGIVAATQTEKIQQKKFSKSKIANENPFVHFDLENRENSDKFLANFNPERRLNMRTELKNLVTGKSGIGGFCFRSDTQVKQAFVLTARTLNNKPLHQYITKQYLNLMIERTVYNSETAGDFERCIRNIQNSDNDANPRKINPILLDNEEFTFKKEENKFFLRFDQREEFIIMDIQEV